MSDNFRERLDSIINSVVRSGGRVMLIGPTDSGKTTVAKKLIQALIAKRRPVGFLDVDLGQSTIGPPGTIGAAVYHRFDENGDAEGQATSTAITFIGSFASNVYQTEIMTAVQKMLDFLRHHQCRDIIIDTTGLIFGTAGLQLKLNKIACIKPHHLILIDDGKNYSIFGDLYANAQDMVIHAIQKNLDIIPRSIELRRRYRLEKIRKYLCEAREVIIPVPKFIAWRTNIITRSINNTELSTFIETTIMEPVHFSAIANRQLVVVADTWKYSQIQSLRENLPVDHIFFISKRQLIDRLIAVENETFMLLSYGILRAIDFLTGTLTIYASKFFHEDSHILKIGREGIDLA